MNQETKKKMVEELIRDLDYFCVYGAEGIAEHLINEGWNNRKVPDVEIDKIVIREAVFKFMDKYDLAFRTYGYPPKCFQVVDSLIETVIEAIIKSDIIRG